MTWEVYLTRDAELDIDDIFIYGLKNFSKQLAIDYDLLIEQAILDLKDDPHRIGTSKVKNRTDELFQYDLTYSKSNITVKIKNPNKLIFYYIIENKVIIISRIIRSKAEKEISRIDRDNVTEELKENY